MSEITATAKTAVIYSIGLLINQLAGFLLLPIYTRYLTPADYGVIELLIMTTDVAGMIAGAGVASAVMKYYFVCGDEQARKRLLSTALLMSGTMYLVFSGGGLWFSDRLAVLILEGTDDNVLAFRLVFCIFAIEPVFLLTLVLLRIRQRAGLFVGVVSLRLLLQIILNIAFVVVLRQGYLGVLYSTLISWLVVSLWALPYYLRHSGMSFSPTVMQQLLGFGVPLILLNLGNFVITFSDRYFLKAYADMATVGIYSLGYKMGFVLANLTATPLMSTWEPKRFQLAGSDDFQRINRMVFRYFSMVLITVALAIALFSRDLFRIMSAPEFLPAYRIVPLIMLAYILQAWTDFTNFGIYHRNKTRYFALVGLISSSLILVLSFLLIPRYHAYGAAIATILTFMVRFGLVYFRSQSLCRLRFDWFEVVIVLCFGIAVYGLGRLLASDDILLSLGINGGLLLAFVAGIVMSPVFGRARRRELKRLIRNPVASIKDLLH